MKNFTFSTDSMSCRGVIFEDTCIRLLKTIYDPVDYSTSSDLCSFHGGRLADITTSDTYNKVYKYLQTAWNDYKSTKRDYVHVRLGMKYINGAIVTSTGQIIGRDSLGRW